MRKERTTRNRALRPGNQILVRALKADGNAYRWWKTRVESIDRHHVATVNRPGDNVGGIDRGWRVRHLIRTIYWYSRPYNLVESYEADGSLRQLYVHIASPASLSGHTLTYTDHELDVVLRRGQAPRIADEHEFEEAAITYGYTPEFQESCRRAVHEALSLVASWKAGDPPRMR